MVSASISRLTVRHGLPMRLRTSPGREDGIDGDVAQDFQPQRRDAVACATDCQPHCLLPRHADGDAAAHHLRQLLGEARRHLGCVRVDDFAAVIALDRRPRHGHDVSRLHKLLRFLLRERYLVGAGMCDEPTHRRGQLLSHLHFAAGVADRPQARLRCARHWS